MEWRDHNHRIFGATVFSERCTRIRRIPPRPPHGTAYAVRACPPHRHDRPGHVRIRHDGCTTGNTACKISEKHGPLWLSHEIAPAHMHARIRMPIGTTVFLHSIRTINIPLLVCASVGPCHRVAQLRFATSASLLHAIPMPWNAAAAADGSAATSIGARKPRTRAPSWRRHMTD